MPMLDIYIQFHDFLSVYHKWKMYVLYRNKLKNLVTLKNQTFQINHALIHKATNSITICMT